MKVGSYSIRRCCALMLAIAAFVPDCPRAQNFLPPTGGLAVAVPTKDATGHGLSLNGMLWLPEGRPRAAVVIANGSGGWRDHREGYYGRTLAALGYAVLAIDSFGARGIANTVADQSQLSIVQMARDAFAGKRLLTARGIPADRMAIMGASRGGTVALAAADGTYLPLEQDRFGAAIAYYPECSFRPRVPKPESRVFMLLGDRDDYTGVKPCQDIAGDFSKARGAVTVKIYPGATHTFDGDLANTRSYRDFMAETFIDCVVFVEEDGTGTFAGKRFDLDTGFGDVVKYARQQPCAGHGTTMWTNPKQKEIALHDVIEFLNAAFPS